MILILSSCAFVYIRALHVKSPRPPAGGGQGCTEHGVLGEHLDDFVDQLTALRQRD